MTHFHVSLDLTCPSDWSVQQVRDRVERLCANQQEKDSIRVSEIGRSDKCEWCGQPRNYSLDGILQSLCWNCAGRREGR